MGILDSIKKTIKKPIIRECFKEAQNQNAVDLIVNHSIIINHLKAKKNYIKGHFLKQDIYRAEAIVLQGTGL